MCRRFDSVPGPLIKWHEHWHFNNQQINRRSLKSVSLQFRYTQKGKMASIRKHHKKYQVLIRRKGHPLICKSLASYSDATKYAQESESNIAKGLYADLSEANQTLLKDALQRYKEEVTAKKKGAKQEAYKIVKTNTSNTSIGLHRLPLTFTLSF